MQRWTTFRKVSHFLTARSCRGRINNVALHNYRTKTHSNCRLGFSFTQMSKCHATVYNIIRAFLGGILHFAI